MKQHPKNRIWLLGIPSLLIMMFGTGIFEEDVSPTYADYHLEIPSIGLASDMQPASISGYTLTVPDDAPGYLKGEGLLIMGHNEGVFKHLNETPTSLGLWLEGESHQYTLVQQQIVPTEDAHISELADYHGVVLMTCFGQKINQTYNQRLILYYQPITH